MRVIALVLLAVTAASLSVGTTATAATSHWPKLVLSLHGKVWAKNIDRPLFGRHTVLVPGDRQVRTFYARNQSNEKARLLVSLRLTGERHGLLAHKAFRLGVRRDGGRWHRVTSDDGRTLRSILIRRGEVVPVSVRIRLGHGANNRTMHQHLSFRIKVRLTERKHQVKR